MPLEFRTRTDLENQLGGELAEPWDIQELALESPKNTKAVTLRLTLVHSDGITVRARPYDPLAELPGRSQPTTHRVHARVPNNGKTVLASNMSRVSDVIDTVLSYTRKVDQRYGFFHTD